MQPRKRVTSAPCPGLTESRPEVGRQIFLAGYWHGQPAPNLPPDATTGVRSWLRANVVETPRGRSDQLIHAEVTDFDFMVRLHGMSGGAALVWDEDSGSFVLIGIVVGGYWNFTDWWVVIHPLPDF